MKVIDTGQEECKTIRSYLDSYLNDELLVETNHEVLAHLKGCTACTGFLKEKARIKASLRSAVMRQEVPGDLQERIQKSLRRRRPESYQWMLAAAAAALVLLGGAWGALRLQHRSHSGLPDSDGAIAAAIAEQDAAVMNIGLGDHIHCAIDSGFANQHFSDEEMSRALGPDYQGLVSLVRGKASDNLEVMAGHRCQYDGREFVHLVLKNAQAVLSVVITRKTGESFYGENARKMQSNSALRHVRIQELEVAGFETKDYLAFVVSNLQMKDNLRVASALAPDLQGFLRGIEGRS